MIVDGATGEVIINPTTAVRQEAEARATLLRSRTALSRGAEGPVATADGVRITLEANSRPDYREKLDKELAAIRDSEMWQTGAAVRSLRPENWKKQ